LDKLQLGWSAVLGKLLFTGKPESIGYSFDWRHCWTCYDSGLDNLLPGKPEVANLPASEPILQA